MYSFFLSLSIQVTHDVSALERVMHDFTNICQGWCDKAKVVVAKKNVVLQCLQATTEREKEAVEQEKKQIEEISKLKANLESVHADLGSAN